MKGIGRQLGGAQVGLVKRVCGDCNRPIVEDDLVVRVGADFFHARCYMPASWLANVRETVQRQQHESEPSSRPSW
ncbi:MAG TPA: hypothetical protein VJ650_10030 [Gemmatimonadaceae bacterium]|nr:hypothetical protein [Gemmatimonadaceae bacterium]